MLQTLDARAVAAGGFERTAQQALLVTHCDRYTWPSVFEGLTSYYSSQTLVSTFADAGAARELTLGEAGAYWNARQERWNCYVPPQPAPELEAIDRLLDIVAKLRSPDGGCPWDRAQTPESLTPYLLEEAYETAAAIRSGDRDEIVQELGDYLFQVVLQAQIFSEAQAFSLAEVATSISDKLVRRHPHVFGPDAGEIAVSDIKRNWEMIKAAERADETLAEKLHHYAIALPPLMAATKITKKLVRLHGLKSDRDLAVQKLNGACERLISSAGDRDAAALGDVLLAVVQLACDLDLDPSLVLQQANEALAARQQSMPR